MDPEIRNAVALALASVTKLMRILEDKGLLTEDEVQKEFEKLEVPE